MCKNLFSRDFQYTTIAVADNYRTIMQRFFLKHLLLCFLQSAFYFLEKVFNIRFAHRFFISVHHPYSIGNPLNDLNLAALYSECVHQRVTEYFLLEVAA